MGLNKQKGNMYAFVTHTINYIKGRCLHNCTYCFMQPKWKYLEQTGHSTKLRLDEKELKTNLGEGNFIFVGSGTDMWANDVPAIWIKKILEHLDKFPDNTYLFQTKHPIGFNDMKDGWVDAKNIVLGITLETNRVIDNISKAPAPTQRAIDFAGIDHPRKMLTIEPIISFDLTPFVNLIKMINPEWVNIGADSGGNKLPEPPKEKVLELIDELKMFTVVKNKTNLKRLIGEV